MTSGAGKSPLRIYIDYARVHKDTQVLFTKLKAISAQGVILIAVARGGWITTRLLAAAYEESGIENHAYSVSATYKNIVPLTSMLSLCKSLMMPPSKLSMS